MKTHATPLYAAKLLLSLKRPILRSYQKNRSTRLFFSTNLERGEATCQQSDTYTDFLELEKEVGGHGMQVSCSNFASQVQFFRGKQLVERIHHFIQR